MLIQVLNMSHTERFTKHGYELSVLKSGLQKSIRRGDSRNALLCALEIHQSLKNTDSVWNTLFMVAAEDIGMGCPTATLRLLQLYESSEHSELQRLTQAVVYACEQHKSRAMCYAAVIGCSDAGSPESVDCDVFDALNFVFPATVASDSSQEVAQMDQSAVLKTFSDALMTAQCLQSIEPPKYEGLIWLYHVTLAAYQLHESEGRIIETQLTKNPFLKYKSSLSNAVLYKRLFSERPLKFHRGANSLLWRIVLEAAVDEDNHCVDVVAALAEVAARGLGSETLQLLLAVTLVRCYSEAMWAVYQGEHSWTISDVLNSTSTLTVEAVESLLATRPIRIQDHWLDKHTFRGRGVDTLKQFKEWAVREGFDTSGWTDDDYVDRCCLPPILNPRDMQHFLEVGAVVENEIDFFTHEFSSRGKQLYSEGVAKKMTRSKHHRAHAYKHTWLPRFQLKKRRQPPPPTAGDTPETSKKQKTVEERKEKELHAQKRTSASKKHVYVTEQYVYKGPYQKGSKRLHTLLARHKLLGGLLSDVTVQPYCVVEWEDGCYLRFENVATTARSQWKLVETSTLKGREHIKLIERSSMGIRLLSECIAELNERQLCQVLYHLLLRFCCAPPIGDTHLGNMLYNGKRVIGLDLEDNRGSTDMQPQTTQPLTADSFVQLLFTKKQPVKHVCLLAETLLRNKSKFVRALQLVKHIINTDTMDELKRDVPTADIRPECMQKRLLNCMRLLDVI